MINTNNKKNSNFANKKTYSIGICIQYDEGVYTLAVIRFKKKNDVIIYQHIGNYMALKNKKKWDPHVTYHGKKGLHHVKSYNEPFLSKNKQNSTRHLMDERILLFSHLVVIMLNILNMFARDLTPAYI